MKLLVEHKLCAPELQQPVSLTQKEHPANDKLPTDVIPFNLYTLATCWRNAETGRSDYAVNQVVDIISQDDRLKFLRQNVFQEAAKYFAECEQYERADELLTQQLEIVRRKGSQVLLDFVTTNWLINQGNLHAMRNEFELAEMRFREALALIESEWEPRAEQVDLLNAGWNRLEVRIHGNAAL